MVCSDFYQTSLFLGCHLPLGTAISTRVKYSKTFVQQFLLSITLPNPHPLSVSQHLRTSEPSPTLAESTSPHVWILCINFHFRFISICMLVIFGLVFERMFLMTKFTFEPSSQLKFPILKELACCYGN